MDECTDGFVSIKTRAAYGLMVIYRRMVSSWRGDAALRRGPLASVSAAVLMIVFPDLRNCNEWRFDSDRSLIAAKLDRCGEEYRRDCQADP